MHAFAFLGCLVAERFDNARPKGVGNPPLPMSLSCLPLPIVPDVIEYLFGSPDLERNRYQGPNTPSDHQGYKNWKQDKRCPADTSHLAFRIAVTFS